MTSLMCVCVSSCALDSYGSFPGKVWCQVCSSSTIANQNMLNSNQSAAPASSLERPPFPSWSESWFLSLHHHHHHHCLWHFSIYCVSLNKCPESEVVWWMCWCDIRAVGATNMCLFIDLDQPLVNFLPVSSAWPCPVLTPRSWTLGWHPRTG